MNGQISFITSSIRTRPTAQPTNERMAQPDPQVHQHDHAEMNRIDAELHHTGNRIGVVIGIDGAISTRHPSTSSRTLIHSR